MKFHKISTCICSECLATKTFFYDSLAEPLTLKPRKEETVPIASFWSNYTDKLPAQPVTVITLRPKASNIEIDRNNALIHLNKTLKHLVNTHNLIEKIEKCEALGCGTCSIIRCVAYSDEICCTCSHCPYKVAK